MSKEGQVVTATDDIMAGFMLFTPDDHNFFLLLSFFPLENHDPSASTTFRCHDDEFRCQEGEFRCHGTDKKAEKKAKNEKRFYL